MKLNINKTIENLLNDYNKNESYKFNKIVESNESYKTFLNLFKGSNICNEYYICDEWYDLMKMFVEEMDN